MTWALKCFAGNPPNAPCDADWSVDAIAVLGISFSAALVILGGFALVYLLATRRDNP